MSGGGPSEARRQDGMQVDPGAEEVGTVDTSFVPALANVLTHLASLAARPQRVTRFHAVRAPQLSVHDYLVRIQTYFQCSHECFVLGLVYIDRIVKLHPEFTICNLNIHRLLVTSVILAAKFFDDTYYSNAYYARVGGVQTQELNALEALFLQLIEWRLHVLPQEYEQYRNHVLTAVRSAPVAAIRLNPYQQPAPDTPWGPSRVHEAPAAPSVPAGAAPVGATATCALQQRAASGGAPAPGAMHGAVPQCPAPGLGVTDGRGTPVQPAGADG